MAKQRIAVLMGGKSLEHDVSMRSGELVVQHLPADRFEAVPVVIGRDGRWRFGEKERIAGLAEAIAELSAGFDCAFLALHGPYGEDGRFQGMLDLAGIPYTGPGAVASGLAIDKMRAKLLARGAGVRVAQDLVVFSDEWHADPEGVLARVEAQLGYPCVAKSPSQGSSLGMAIPKHADGLSAALTELFSYDNLVLIEEFIAGTEVTCGVLETEPGRQPVALPVTEIVPVDAPFFDYEAKYTPGATEEITPARIAEKTTQEVQQLALRIHQAFGCRGMSRSDMIIVKDEPVWLEVNTIPGLTETSLLPKGAAAAGITYPMLITALIDEGIARLQQRRRIGQA
jgi:D-alanine-D-alanine ligase